MSGNVTTLFQIGVGNPTVRQRILSLPTLESRVAAAVALGHERGLPVSEAEARAALSSITMPGGELSDAELGAVVGGKNGDYIYGTEEGEALDGGKGRSEIMRYNGEKMVFYPIEFPELGALFFQQPFPFFKYICQFTIAFQVQEDYNNEYCCQ